MARRSAEVAPSSNVRVPEGIENPEVYSVAVDVLSSSSEDQPMSSSDLVQKVSEKLRDSPAGYLVYRALLQSTHVPESQVKSRKGRGGGYFLGKPEVDQNVEENAVQLPKEERTLEKHLWPIVVDWLRLNRRFERVSSDIANLKSGGVWSNPDIVGLNILEDLGFFDVEITTLEVKPALTSWRYFFFEAVSHKRFAERVYFVYRSEGATDSEQKHELLRYAEKYGVGLIEIQLDDDDYKRLASWAKKSDSEKTKVLEAFVEIVPAPFEAISAREKIAFLRQIGVSSKAELYAFGQQA